MCVCVCVCEICAFVGPDNKLFTPVTVTYSRVRFTK